MTFKNVLFVSIALFINSFLYGQHSAIHVEKLSEIELSLDRLDSNYMSAVNVDTSLAVFKTPEEQKDLHRAYVQLLQDFGKFLTDHDFYWDRSTRGYNRIYFENDGSIDYFIFKFFPDKEGNQLSEGKKDQFEYLLNLFIQDYKISVQASTKFAQCSPTTYMPVKKD